MAKRSDEPADEVARLYSVPLDEFVDQRDAVAKRLQKDGDREGAKRIKALRKPNLPAAAINRAVRAEPKATKALIAAGEALERAQNDVLGGGDAAKLRSASVEHGEAVERLMAAVVDELDGAGGAGAEDRARETLRAVAADEELRDELSAGTLVRDRESVGFGSAPTGDVAPRPAREPKPARGRAKGAKGSTKASKAAAAKEAKRASAAARKRADQAVRRAERSLEAAASRAKDAERRLERARRGLGEAEEELADAERERDAREAELGTARDALERL